MKDLLETITLILFFALCLGLVFLFHGEPSVWETLSMAAIGACR